MLTSVKDRTTQTKWLRSELKRAEELRAQWDSRAVEMTARLVEHLCPFKPGDKLMRVPVGRGSWELTHILHWKPDDIRELKRVRFYQPTCAFDRNPIFAVVLDPSYGGTIGSNEVMFTLNQLKRCFKKVEP